MSQFMLLLNHVPADFADVSPEEVQAIIEEYKVWTNKLMEEKRLVSSNKLFDDPGKVIRPEGKSAIITDGPFSETKEMLGGYYVIEAQDYKEAMDIAKTSPHMRFGSSIIVREIHLLH